MTNETKTYNAGDLQDAYSLGENDLHWMSTALEHTRKEVKRLQQLAKENHFYEGYFSDLITHLDMYSYLAEERCNQHAALAKEYKQEWEASKQKAVA